MITGAQSDLAALKKNLETLLDLENLEEQRSEQMLGRGLRQSGPGAEYILPPLPHTAITAYVSA